MHNVSVQCVSCSRVVFIESRGSEEHTTIMFHFPGIGRSLYIGGQLPTQTETILNMTWRSTGRLHLKSSSKHYYDFDDVLKNKHYLEKYAKYLNKQKFSSYELHYHF